MPLYNFNVTIRNGDKYYMFTARAFCGKWLRRYLWETNTADQIVIARLS